ncbi:allophanate hydrolase subunit 1 [Dactylosporangium sp. AC04546]|uniref:5-oxoprolinase subunit B family protein n=1 Tax=Dactylosporangium sp. AC04546 TaxID=2862460 RepID=UPI001EE05B05|nr:allophanate hydrolase subunit 1 [Dactylosporangium sp. AC04546]WVK83971.1 allophanate hydrolase subunit 1 [Dactylosporangium sp. AC04546]
MDVRRVGGNALLIEVDDPLAWFAHLDAERRAGRLPAVDIVPGARTVLLDGVSDTTAVAAALRDARPPTRPPAAAAPVELPVRFDGEDLPFVAEHVGATVDAVVATVLGTELRVAFCGFAPGFAYLTGLPWSLPRLPSPRPRVPAGAVGLAAEFLGVYPTASPGGWRLIGRTDSPLFDVDRDPPALLAPGRTVRIVAA